MSLQVFDRRTLLKAFGTAGWVPLIALPWRERHKGQARVAVYPYGGIQEEELSLDE